jgi:transcriptional regulator with XRE-family HTH domain
MLAGISAGYYMRLEQGRDHRPSEHVLKALARALKLDDDATAHCSRWGARHPVARNHARRATSVSRLTCRTYWTPGPPPPRSSVTAGWMCWRQTRWPAR